jgi:hypothetical protein
MGKPRIGSADFGWPRPGKPPGEDLLLEIIDEYERRAVAIGLPESERDRAAFTAYRSLALCARRWLDERIGSRPARMPATEEHLPAVRPCLLRQALDALAGEDPGAPVRRDRTSPGA